MHEVKESNHEWQFHWCNWFLNLTHKDIQFWTIFYQRWSIVLSRQLYEFPDRHVFRTMLLYPPEIGEWYVVSQRWPIFWENHNCYHLSLHRQWFHHMTIVPKVMHCAHGWKNMDRNRVLLATKQLWRERGNFCVFFYWYFTKSEWFEDEAENFAAHIMKSE